MKCPYCDTEMQPGYIKSARPIHWSAEKKLYFFLSDKDIPVSNPNDEWFGCFADALFCPNCKKCIVSMHTYRR